MDSSTDSEEEEHVTPQPDSPRLPYLEKGKGIDLHNWGNISFKEENGNGLVLQQAALASFGTQSQASGPRHFLRDTLPVEEGEWDYTTTNPVSVTPAKITASKADHKSEQQKTKTKPVVLNLNLGTPGSSLCTTLQTANRNYRTTMEDGNPADQSDYKPSRPGPYRLLKHVLLPVEGSDNESDDGYTGPLAPCDLVNCTHYSTSVETSFVSNRDSVNISADAEANAPPTSTSSKKKSKKRKSKRHSSTPLTDNMVDQICNVVEDRPRRSKSSSLPQPL